jgi:hypothetical protein
VRASCCCNTCCCGVVSCVLRCACMCVLGDSYCVKTFYRRWFVDVCVCVDQLITNNFYFFFKYHNEIGYILFILSSSCHVMSYHVVLTSLSCVTKFFSIHFFFILCLIVVIIMSLLNVRSYSSSHHTCHHTSASVNFFFFASSLLLQCVVTQHSWCCEIVMVSCVDSLACVSSWNFVSKKSSRTFVIPAHTSLRSHVPAFMSPTRGMSQSCEYATHASKNASHIATLALDVPFPSASGCFF